MSYSYKVNKRKFKTSDGEVKEKYYACAKRYRLVDTEQLANDISNKSSLTPGDVLSALYAVSGVIKANLVMGNTVNLDGIGTFSLSITSDGADDPKKINARSIKVKRICYKSDRGLSRGVKEVEFVKEKNPPKGLVIRKSK